MTLEVLQTAMAKWNQSFLLVLSSSEVDTVGQFFFFRIVPCISLFCCRKFLKTKVDWISLICNNLSYVLVTKIPFIGTYWSDVPQHAVVWLVSLWKCQLFFDTNDGWSSNLQKLFSCQRRKATGITDSCANNGHFSAEVFSYR